MANMLIVDKDKRISIGPEWLDTNGLGSYASCSIDNCNRRKYHGLLVCSQKFFEDKFVLLSKFEESVFVGDNEFFLNKSYYEPGIYVPGDDKTLNSSFLHSLVPTTILENDQIRIKREVAMVHGQDITMISYSFENLSDDKTLNKIYLKLKPMLAYRIFHHNGRERDELDLSEYSMTKKTISFKPSNDLSDLFINSNVDINFEHFPCWYKNFHYSEEVNRGYDYIEDLACPGVISLELSTKKPVFVAVSTEDLQKTVPSLWKSEITRREKITKKSQLKDASLAEKLEYAADQFFIKSLEDSYTIIAGYHWFGSWGRDTMISLPGTLLGTQNEKNFSKVLRRFLDFKKDGLIPNIIASTIESSSYNSVDASLWLFWALQQFLYKKKCSHAIIKKKFWVDLKDIFISYLESKPEHLTCNELGLLESGTDAESYTWMDACLFGSSVIPRKGMVVEINALWFNAVSFIEELAIKFKDMEVLEQAIAVKEKIKVNFRPQFFLEDEKYLADYIFEGIKNKQLRPNQLLAISLPYSPLDKETQKIIVDKCEEELLTPFGMRTLARDDANYRGRYEGDVIQRDLAYHNGTVWTWLLGPFYEAFIKVSDNKELTLKRVKTMIEYFETVLESDGMYSIAEIFDGDSPYEARGCIAQAWSVAELRRIYLEINS